MRLRKVVRLDPQTPGRGHEHGGARCRARTRKPSPPAARKPAAAGRRNLVRQAVQLLVHYPGIADKVGDLTALQALDRPGIPLIVQLVEELHAQPCEKTAVLLERWRVAPMLGTWKSSPPWNCTLRIRRAAAQELLGAAEALA